jgi:ketopantoate reductase
LFDRDFRRDGQTVSDTTLWTTLVPTPKVLPILRMPSPLARSSLIRASTDGFTRRRPSFVPFWRARAKPAFTRSRIIPRSNSAKVLQVGTFMRMIFGEFDRKLRKRGEDFLALCLKAGFDATLSEQILTELWMKFILLASNAGIMALTRQPIGKLRDDPDLRPIFMAAWREAIDVGRARGVALPADALEKILDFTSHAPPAMKASMALDLERGSRLELPWLGGKVVELGRQLGVPTPTHSMMYAMLKPYIMGTPA